jgi:hypothetical protein
MAMKWFVMFLLVATVASTAPMRQDLVGSMMHTPTKE